MTKESYTVPAPIKPMLVGGLSGAGEALINHPLWVWKTRFQCGEPFTLKPRVIYKGLPSSVNFMAFVTSFRVGFMDLYGHRVCKTNNPTFFQDASGAFGGGVTTAIFTSPLEFVLTQKQSPQYVASRQSFLPMYSRIISKHGIKAGLTGIGSVAMRDGFNSFGFFSLSPHFKNILKEKNSFSEANASLLGGVSAGVFATAISHPFDTIKTLQHAKFNTAGYENLTLFKSARHIFYNEGLKGMYKGFLWRSARAASAAVILPNMSEKLRCVI